MKRLTDSEIREMLACERLTSRERTIARLFYLDHLRAHVIGHRLGLSGSAITSSLSVARRKVSGEVTKRVGRPKRYPLDEAWFRRQVEYVRKIAADPEHQGRYLNGIEMCHGTEMRERVEAAA